MRRASYAPTGALSSPRSSHNPHFLHGGFARKTTLSNLWQRIVETRIDRYSAQQVDCRDWTGRISETRVPEPSLLTHPRRGGLNQNTGSACRLLRLAVILLFSLMVPRHGPTCYCFTPHFCA